MVLADDG
jgi:hypothetical protein